MRKPITFTAIITILASSPCFAAPTSTVAVAMRDGVQLATDVYVPDGPGPFPVVVMRTPYDRASGTGTGDALRDAGVATVVQDMRGRFDSQGTDCIFRCDGDDGFDTLAWVEQQSWCNGRVVTWGGSALGIVQYMAAVHAPPVLDAMWADVATPSAFEHMLFQGGAFRQSMIEGWLQGQGSEFFLQDLAAHPFDDGFYDPVQTSDRFSLVTVPAVHYGGWYDIFGQGTIDAFVGYQHEGGAGAKGKQKLVMGPWTHAINTVAAGELVYPDNASGVPGGSDEMLVTWLLYHLGLNPDPAGVDAIPAVQYYVMGDVGDPGAPGNEWRSANDWPVPAAPVRMHLHPDGTLSESCPSTDGGTTGYSYDPLDPTPTIGGANLLIPAGPMDQSAVEARPDVITFTTPVLTAPMEITGRVKAFLWVETDVVDTDVVVRMTDVHPDGRSMLVLDGVLRLGYRNGAKALAPMTPGEPELVAVDLWSTSIILNAGHRLRVSITSSNAPRFWPNPNDGTTYGQVSNPVVANVAILHDAAHASYIELPDPNRPEDAINVCWQGGGDAGMDEPDVSDSGQDVVVMEDGGADGGADGAADGGAAGGGGGGSVTTPKPGDEDGGCGCRVGADQPLRGPGFLLLIGIAGWFWRRRSTWH